MSERVRRLESDGHITGYRALVDHGGEQMTTRDDMREKLRIKPTDLEVVNAVLTGEDNALVGGLLDLVEKYGGVEEINRKADEAGVLETRLARLQDEGSPFLADLQWLTEQRDAGAFVTLPEYRRGRPR